MRGYQPLENNQGVLLGTSHTSVTAYQTYRILLVIYEFAPLGSPQIIRWANMARFLAEEGCHVTVLTTQVPDDYPLPVDPSMSEIVDHPNIEIKRLPVSGPGGRKALGWIWRAYRTIGEMVKETHYDLLISSALPIWSHFVGSMARARGYVKAWVPDYGDPWSTSRTLGQKPLKKAVEFVVERAFLSRADAITVTTPTAIDTFKPLYKREERILAVLMGASYFHIKAHWEPVNHPRSDDTLHLLYTGGFYPTREPDRLYDALARVPGVDLTIAGRSYDLDMDAIARQYGVEDKITLLGYKNQKEVVALQQVYDVLLLTSWPVPEQISGKFFEYVATNRPILYITDHERDLASDFLHERGIGMVCRNDAAAIAQALKALRDQARAGTLEEREPDMSMGFDESARTYLRLVQPIIRQQS